MMDEQRFTLTEEHVALARRMYVGWEDCEFGAPAIDCKRPYGNSDVVDDIREIIEGEPGEYAYDRNGELPPADVERYEALHKEMQQALQVILSAGTFEPGEYCAPAYTANWARHS